MGVHDFVTHHKDKPEWERVLGTWSELHVRNSPTFEFQDQNNFRERKMAAGFGEGEGSGRGGNPLWMIIWFLILFFIGEIVKQLD